MAKAAGLTGRVAFDDLTRMAHEDQVGDPDVAEAHGERVHPEVVRQLRVAGRDVPGHALGEAEATEQPQRAGQLLLAVQALLLHGGELRRGRRQMCSGPSSVERACSIPRNYRLAHGLPHRRPLDIAAPAEKVWALVSDLPRMGEWSPENAGGKWVKGATGPALGAVFKGTNKNGFRRWSTAATVIACEPGKVFEFAVTSGPLGRRQLALRVRGHRAGCRVTESWVDQRKAWFATLARVMGDHSAEHAEEEMKATLAKLGRRRRMTPPNTA